MNAVITITGKDRPGIIAALTGEIVRLGGNLEDASMTILEGEFAMICLTSFKKASVKTVSNALQGLSKKNNLSISVRELNRKLERGEKHRSGTQLWLISLICRDRAGIVYEVSRLLADQGVNITDLDTRIIGQGPKTSFALVLEAEIVSKTAMVDKIKKLLRTLERKFEARIEFHPVDLAVM